ncbi:MAG TPA: bifunctional oligoribonuclease/PAP phosphatase NrnA [Candidatus Moranbacteria bacterium]|nr:bifunctional oligoribonuclease/PAP phosphatase NrnA [Candidatus Moranbacteria bacterium]
MPNFFQEFHTLNYTIKNSDNVLLFAHSRPDGDTAGASLALKEYIKNIGGKAEVACFDPLPDYLKDTTGNDFKFPSQIDLGQYKLIIATDSVDRGFNKIKDRVGENQITAILDHHPDITTRGDINIIDPAFSSVCEIVYEFFIFNKIEINRKMATCLMLGILGDTGMFQHSNTTPHALEIASHLMKLGAPLSKIVQMSFSNKKISTLKLWGKAFEKAKIDSKNGMIFTVLTQNDIAECEASNDDIAQVSGILNTVPGTRFAMILSERGDGIVKGSLRSEEYKDVDVSKIAARLGGGGHKLASGFEIKGKIVETEDGWKII